MAAPVHAQNYQFAKIVDNATPRPDGAGPFAVSAATFDGTAVVFENFGFYSSESIWATDGSGGYTKLADRNTPVPGGNGTFSYFDEGGGRPQLRNGVVLFLAYDSSPNYGKPGFYTVPVTGGDITVVVDTNTIIPETTATFDSLTYSDANGGFGFDGSNLVFWGHGTPFVAGLYSVGIDGSGLTRVADSNTPVATTSCDSFIGSFDTPSVNNGMIAYRGSGVLGSTGFNGLYTRPVLPYECPDPSTINSEQGLPGSGENHTAFVYAQTDVGRVVFTASSCCSGLAFGGLYVTDGGGLSIIADVTTPLPGLADAPWMYQNFRFAVDQGNVLFYVQDSSNQTALFLASGGNITRVIGSGDVLDGNTVSFVDPPIYGDVSGQNFVCHLSFDPYGIDHAIYLATSTPSGLSLSADPSAVTIPPGGNGR
jgi:hypothetical protein